MAAQMVMNSMMVKISIENLLYFVLVIATNFTRECGFTRSVVGLRDVFQEIITSALFCDGIYDHSYFLTRERLIMTEPSMTKPIAQSSLARDIYMTPPLLSRSRILR